MTKLKWMWLVAVPLAVAACTAQHMALKEPTMWELACADVIEVECGEQVAPDLVDNSWLVQELTGGAMGVFVYNEWRIYMAPVSWIVLNGYTYEQVLYHESVHAVYTLSENPPSRCKSERLAREMTDARFGTSSATNGWEDWYGCRNVPWRIGV